MEETYNYFKNYLASISNDIPVAFVKPGAALALVSTIIDLASPLKFAS